MITLGIILACIVLCFLLFSQSGARIVALCLFTIGLYIVVSHIGAPTL